MLAPIPLALSDDLTVRQWFGKLRDAVNVAPQVVGSVSLSAQSSALANVLKIGIAPTLATSVYRVSLQMRVTQAAGVSSSLGWVVSWTDGGVAMTQAIVAPITSNLVTGRDSAVFLLRADTGTNIAVDTTYASAGSPVVLYAIDVRIEAMPTALAIP